MNKISDPSILYFGTPVVLISSINEDGTTNLAPISSVFWLGWRCIIGISALSKTAGNMLRTKQAVLNLPSIHQAAAVNKLALTTGSNPIPEGKKQKGYRYEPDKFSKAGLTEEMSHLVLPSRVKECPVQMETSLTAIHPIAEDNEQMRGKLLSLELKVLRVHLDTAIMMDGYTNRVDPDKWRPLMMSFQELYGLGDKIITSTLAEIPEQLYRSPEIPEI